MKGYSLPPEKEGVTCKHRPLFQKREEKNTNTEKSRGKTCKEGTENLKKKERPDRPVTSPFHGEKPKRSPYYKSPHYVSGGGLVGGRH